MENEKIPEGFVRIDNEPKEKTKEDIRHEEIMDKINNAKTKNELPRVTLNNLLRYFSDNAHFEEKIQPSLFEPVVDLMEEKGGIHAPEVKEEFIKILKKNYPGKEESEYEAKFKNIDPKKATHLYIEFLSRLDKIGKLERQEFLDKHNSIMKKINDAFEFSELPLVTKGTLNGYLCDNSRIFSNSLKVSDISSFSDELISGKDISSDEMYNKLYEICKSKNPDLDENFFHDYYARLIYGDRLDYIIKEINARDKKVAEIYRENHEETMENIKNAKRISQLPPNLSFSTLAGYLSSNTTVFPKSEKISSTKFTEITDLILKGKTFDDDEIKYLLLQIAADTYPDRKEEAYEVLLDKLKSLPRTYYLRDEINYSNERQKEFIGRGGSNVNVYLIPNPNSPVEGGRFYNCYINRIDNLDLSEIVPLNLEEIVPEDMDVDAIEWYVQENYDETFKTAGGIILNKDETIGNVNIFAPSDGRIGITPEQRDKYQELEEVSKRVKTIIARKKEETEAFSKYQEEFLKRQATIDEELALLEEKIDLLTSEENDKGAR